MKPQVAVIFIGASLLMGLIFLIPSGRGAAAAYAPMTGKAWVLPVGAPRSAAEPVATALVAVSSAPAPQPVDDFFTRFSGAAASTTTASQVPAPRPRHKVESRRERGGQRKTPRASGRRHSPHSTRPAAPPAVSIVRPSTPTAVVAATAAAATVGQAALQDYALDDIAERYEADESKFPLDRSRELAGITVSLVGLERRDQGYVIKVEVSNSGPEDFFVKGFAVATPRLDMSSRAIFRVLVEPRRTRAGYVFFARPPKGADVHVELKEDGGKDRSVDLAIPYSF